MLTIDPIVVYRYESGQKRDLNTMYSVLVGELMKNYSIEKKDVVKNVNPNHIAQAHAMMAAAASSTHLNVAPPFIANNGFTVAPRVEVPWMLPLVQQIDRSYMARYGIQLRTPVWSSPEDDIVSTRVESLRSLCLKQLSWTHYAFGQRHGYHSWLSTDEYFDAEDMHEMYMQHQEVHGKRDQSFFQAATYGTEAVDMMYKYFIKHSTPFHSLRFSYNPCRYVEEMKMNSSAGLRPGGSIVVGRFMDRDVIQSPLGQKMEQIEGAVRTHMKWVRDMTRMTFNPLVVFSVIKIKIERRMKYAGTVSQLAALRRKKREFFITNILHQIHSAWIDGPRILAERGSCINIGRVWWNGGAYELARYLRFDAPMMKWFEGDHRRFDKTVIAALLAQYQAANMMYYDMDSMTEMERKIFIFANIQSYLTLISKLTCHVGGEWQLMDGIMPSGTKVTSHGDSWIVCYTFCSYLIDVIRRYPGRAVRIWFFIQKGMIRIAIYGDDHLWCCPRELTDIINEESFAQFVEEVFHMVIQEPQGHSNFFVEVDLAGNIKKAGPKFLKRYFVRGQQGEPPVLPFKPTAETLSKVLAPKSSSMGDMLLSVIGQAWDTMFTNPVSYALLSDMYLWLTQNLKRPIQEVLKESNVNTNKERYDWIMKLGIKDGEIDRGFPDYHSRRKEYHTYDVQRCSFAREIFQQREMTAWV